MSQELEKNNSGLTLALGLADQYGSISNIPDEELEKIGYGRPNPLNLNHIAPLSRIQKREGKQGVSESYWRTKILEGMDAIDKDNLIKLRELLQSRGFTQRWYYGGAGKDIIPVIIAPPDTEHWWVDPVYDSSAGIHMTYGFEPSEGETTSEVLGRQLTEPFRKLGAGIETVRPWNEALKSKRQSILIDGQTKIELFGNITSEAKTLPPSINVVYTSAGTIPPHPSVIDILKVGGILLHARDISRHSQPNDTERSFYNWYNVNLLQTGMERLGTVTIDTLHFPQIENLRSQLSGTKVAFDLLEKTRNFSPDNMSFMTTVFEEEESGGIDPRSKKWADYHLRDRKG